MDTIEQKDRAMTPPKATSDTPKVAPLPAPYRKEFSLTSGAKYLGIGKGTLRAAIERDEIKATKNAKGHYVIEGAEIFQYEQNLDADEIKPVPAPVSTRANTRASTGISTPANTGAMGGADTGADTPSGTGDDTPSDRRVGTVSADMHRTIIDGLETRLRDKDGTIRDLQDSVESWKTQAKSWQNHADNNLRLLSDEREKLTEQEPDSNLIAAEQGVRKWFRYVAVLTTAAVIGGGYFYRADLAEQWAKFTTAGDATAAVESDPEMPQG